MRKFLTTCLFFIITLSAFAQKGHFDPEQFKADMRQYITHEAQLTPAEAQAFFPLFEQMQQLQREKFIQLNKLRKNKPVGEKACKEAIMKMDELELEMKQIQKTYHSKFLKVLSAQKLYNVVLAESAFHRKAFRKAVKHR